MKKLEHQLQTLGIISAALKILIGCSILAIYGLCGGYEFGDVTTSDFISFTVVAALVIVGAVIGLDMIATSQENLKQRISRHASYMKRNGLFDLPTTSLYSDLMQKYGEFFVTRRTGGVLGIMPGSSMGLHESLVNWCVRNGFPYLLYRGKIMFSEDGINWSEVEGVRLKDGDIQLYERIPLEPNASLY